MFHTNILAKNSKLIIYLSKDCIILHNLENGGLLLNGVTEPQFKLFNFIFNFHLKNGKQKWKTKGWKTIKSSLSYGKQRNGKQKWKTNPNTSSQVKL